MRQLSLAQRVQVVSALVEGCSIRSVVRLTGVHKTTILRLVADLGAACQRFHDEKVRGIATNRVQVDEVWAFCYAKQKNVPADKQGRFGFGDVWTWTALDADTKLMIGWLVGLRDTNSAIQFMTDVSERLVNRVQLTSDGHKSYLVAVPIAFGDDIDYAQLVKIYGPDKSTSTRYSPPALTGVELHLRSGNPDPAHISTSFVERSNLTLRMGMRRATRLTNAFSKKVQNHEHMTAIFWTYYNWCRRHMTLKVTPAVAAGLTHRTWTVADLIELID